MIIKYRLVSFKVVRHDQLLSKNVGQASVGALRHHGLSVLRQFPVEFLVQLLLPFDFFQFLDKNVGKLHGTELVARLGRDSLCSRYEIVC